VRILSLLAVTLAGCYDPVINDCQFTCPDGLCPGDSKCLGGLCRVNGATGDCPCAAPPDGCELVPNSSGLCLAGCKSKTATWSEAKDACAAAGQWQLAVFSTTLVAAERALTMSPSWIGLTRDAVGQNWRWIDGSGSVAEMSPDWTGYNVQDDHSGGILNLNKCAAINNGKLYSDGCVTPHVYACTPD